MYCCDKMNAMSFLDWHYSEGIKYYWKTLQLSILRTHHYYSIPLLVETLFAPWKRLATSDKSPGFDLQKRFEAFTFNLVSRIMGAIVRLVLLFVGIFVVLFTGLTGLLGFLFWILIPYLSKPVYERYRGQPKHYVADLLRKIREENVPPLQAIFGNSAGKYVLSHVGINPQEFANAVDFSGVDFTDLHFDSFKDLTEYLLRKNMLRNEFFQTRDLEAEDFILASELWDKLQTEKTVLYHTEFGSPGIGADLTFGYTPTLNQYATDLSKPAPFSHRLIGRDVLVSRMERILSSGAEIMLTGDPGVGKKTVVLEFAKEAMSGKLGPAMTYKRVIEFDYNSLLSKSVDLSMKKTELGNILAEAAAAGNIILMIKDIHRLTHPDIEGYDFTDIFEKYLERKNLMVIAVIANHDYERFITPNTKLKKFFERIEIVPPNKNQAMEILLEAALESEKKHGVTILLPALRYLLDQSDQIVTELPYPEKVLDLLDSTISYCKQQKKFVLTTKEINTVLSEKTGISFARMTDTEKRRLDNIENIIHKRLVNQKQAVDLIGQTLRAKTVGVIKDKRPMGSFLFLGPTGVGKTETAKVLSQVYYGSEESILRFDMAEYVGSEGLERLIGSFYKNQPGILSTAIRNRPASLLLLDEIEKAPRDIYNLFLALLDEGSFTDAFGRKVDCRHLFIIGTSNAGAEYIRELVQEGVSQEEMQRKVTDYVLQKGIFSPEFVNRFDGVVVYEPLSKENLVQVAHLMLADLAENLKNKNIFLEITHIAAAKLAQDGYDPAFGARVMRRIVSLSIGDLLGRAILKGEIKPGDKIRLLAGEGNRQFVWQKIDEPQ